MQKENASPTSSESTTVHAGATIMPGTLLIDVRTPAEFEAKHISGSHNIPLDQLPSYKDEIAQSAASASLLLICQSGNRARKAVEILRTTSLTSITVLEGGLPPGKRRASRCSREPRSGVWSGKCAAWRVRWCCLEHWEGYLPGSH